MADKPISGLDELTALTNDDYVVVVNDPGGTPRTRRVTVANLIGTIPATGSDTQLLFNDGGVIAGDAGLVYNKTDDTLTIAGADAERLILLANTSSQTANVLEAYNASSALRARITAAGEFSNAQGVTASEAFGAGAVVAVADAAAFGNSASATDRAVAIGESASAAQQGVAIGETASTIDQDSIAIGQGSIAQDQRATVVGKSAFASGGFNVALGGSADATALFAIAIGDASLCSAARSVALGDNTVVSASGAVAIGSNAQATLSGQVVIGSTVAPLTDLFLGKGVTSSTPTEVTLNGTGASGTDTAGGPLTLAPGPGTGDADGGALTLQYAPAGGSGSSQNASENRIVLDATGVNVTGDTLVIADSASVPPLNLTPRSTEPSAPVANDMYWDDGSNTATGDAGFRQYNGSSWDDTGPGSGGLAGTLGSVVFIDGSGMQVVSGQNLLNFDDANGTLTISGFTGDDTPRLVLNAISGQTDNLFEITSSGGSDGDLLNFGAAGRLTIGDSAAIAPLNITERDTAPSSPASGDIYLDDGSNTAGGNPGWRRYTGAVWEDVSSSGVLLGGSDTQVQYNNGGVLGGMATVTFDDATNELSVDLLADTKRRKHQIYESHIDNWDGWAATNTNSGTSSALHNRRGTIDTGTTASSTALRRINPNQIGFSHGKAGTVVNFSKKLRMCWSFLHNSSTTNGKTYLWLGEDTTTVADPATKTIGIRVDQNALKGIVHNGTVLTVVDLSTTLAASSSYYVVAESDGAGNVTWYAGGSSVGSTALGPTGDTTAGEAIFHAAVDNGGDSAKQAANVHQFAIEIAQ